MGTVSLASALVDDLLALGVEEAFGVSGGAMAMLWHAMSASRLRVRHCRHESGAAFAATEASLATGRPVLVFTTTGPGLTNAMTGLLAARDEGATLIVVSACTSAAMRGRFAIQESGPQTLPRGLYESGPLYHFAHRLENAREWPEVARQLARDGIARPLPLTFLFTGSSTSRTAASRSTKAPAGRGSSARWWRSPTRPGS